MTMRAVIIALVTLAGLSVAAASHANAAEVRVIGSPGDTRDCDAPCAGIRKGDRAQGLDHLGWRE